jgi:hypothetical protein
MFWVLEHVSQEDCEGEEKEKKGKGNTTDENVSNVSSDNERLTKDIFFYSFEGSFSRIFFLHLLCLENLNKYNNMRSRHDAKQKLQKFM